MKIFRIYDNGGETFDRYTVYYSGPGTRERRNMRMCLGMSEDPFSPLGFCQHSSGQVGKHNGKRIKFSQLPIDCQKAVKNDLQEVI
jgi:hypothetical protein